MVAVSLRSRHAGPYPLRAIYSFLPIATSNAAQLIKRASKEDPHNCSCKSDEFVADAEHITFAVLIPVLVLLSGLFAGLTLGYMSLDETQLKVLSVSGNAKQREYARKIQPIRKNGHLLLVTLLLANMIVNETLPVIADPVLGGGLQGVVVSTVLIVIFSEIIPQSLFTRHGLYLGAKMAGFTQILIYVMGIIAWPVAKLLEFVLGAHHGIIYRRSELKELIAMHSNQGTHGGDLRTDTVTIIGATLDLQEKIVTQAMTPIEDVFMLSIDSKLDYETLKKITDTGHSRIPVYEDVDVAVTELGGTADGTSKNRTRKLKKILGILLVKQCVLLDPKDATPLRKIPLNKVPFVPNNEPLLGILDKFQEGRSHMAIVSRFSVEKAASVKKAVKRGLTQRLRERVGIADSDSSDSEDDKSSKHSSKDGEELTLNEKEGSESSSPRIPGFKLKKKGFKAKMLRRRSSKDSKSDKDIEMGDVEAERKNIGTENGKKKTTFALPKAAANMASMTNLEQSMPADAVLAKEGANEFLKNFDPAVMPLGIITLEDVLEELIGEEIYDEFDPQGAHGDPYELPPEVKATDHAVEESSLPHGGTKSSPPTHLHVPTARKAFGSLGIFRPRSAPPGQRDGLPPASTLADKAPALAQIPSTDSEKQDPIVTATLVEPSPSATPAPPPALTQSPAPVPDLGSLPAPNLDLGLPSGQKTPLGPIPLEAVLASRGRRLTTGATGGRGASPATSGVDRAAGGSRGGSGPEPIAPTRSSSTAKGNKFKSSPLTPLASADGGAEKDKDAKGKGVEENGE